MKDIAIIAYSGQFPGATSVEAFAQQLREGKTAIGKVSDHRLKDTALPREDLYVKAGYLEDITHFDPAFFDISLGEAEEITPHQRLLLQEAYRTFEMAGYRLRDLQGSNTSVYVGDSPTEYYHLARKGTPSLVAGNLKSINAGRISRFFDLRGAALSIDTACSSTLTAISLAYKDLLLDETDLALICGVNVLVFPNRVAADGVLGIDSPTGECQPFSANANGTLDGEMVACMLLKRLDKAQADGDRIHGVIKGIALNQDAAQSSSIMAPSSTAQTAVIQKALAKAGVKAEEVGLVEAHGTGTKLGDPIEVEGLAGVFAETLPESERVYLSAIKSNIGHTDSAAGLAGVIKVLLSFRYNTLFPSVNALPFNEFIDFDEARVEVLTEAKPWELVQRTPRRIAGISSFGLMGTNAHLILEDISTTQASETSTEVPTEEVAHCFAFTAKSSESLEAYLQKFIPFLSNSTASPSELSRALNCQRELFAHRRLIRARNKKELLSQLKNTTPKDSFVAETQAIFLLFDDTVAIEEAELNELKDRFPALPLDMEKCTSPARTALVLQHTAYQLLSKAARPFTDMIGIGIGKLLIRVLKGELDLEEALDLAEESTGPSSSTADLERRAKHLIGKYAEPIRFVSVGFAGALGEAFAQQASTGTCAHGCFGYTGTDSREQSLFTLLELPETVDPRLLYLAEEQSNIALPSYEFDRLRCWLRKVDDPFSFDQSQHTAPAPSEAAAPIAMVTGQDLLEQLQQLWSGVLKTEVGPTDDFFDLGGHSLNGQQLIVKINEVFETELEIDELFDYGTPAEMEEYLNSLGLESTPGVVNSPQKQLEIEPSENEVHSSGSVGEEKLVLAGKKMELIKKISNKIKVEPKTDIPKLPVEENYAISGSQHRMWILSQFEESSLAYNLPNVMELKGAYDLEAFQKAIRAVISRHEILRTVFKENEAGEVRQWVLAAEEVDFKIAYHDFSELSAPQKRVEQLVASENSQAFDLAKGPLLKAALIYLAPDHYAFYYNMHHIISDGWSMGILLQDVMTYYTAFQSGEEPVLPPLRIQYKDYAAWHNRQLNSIAVQKHRDFWMEQLAGELPVLELPSPKVRPAIMTNKVQVLRTFLSPHTTKQLLKFSREQRGSLFITLLSVWNVLLYRYTEQKDIIIGSPVAGRSHSELENQIGCYINTLALRNQVDGTQRFEDFYAQVKSNTLAAYSHQVFPFEQLVEDLNPPRDLSRNAIFDVLLVLQNTGEKMAAIGVDQQNPEAIQDFGETLSIFDLELIFEEMDDYLSFTFNYNRDCYERPMMERMITHFRNLVEELLSDPTQPIRTAPLLSSEEQNLILETFNDTAVDYDLSLNVVELFQNQARRTPAATALVFEQQKIDYQGLDERSNQLAHYLRQKHQVDATDLVAVHLERSDWMVVSLLAILKTGAAYIPLDIDYPQDRVDYIVQDSQAKLILDDHILHEFQKEQGHYPTVALAPSWKESDLAYVMYTSGSTGQPKGVMIEHRNLSNTIQWYTDQFNVNSDTVALMLTSISFDPSLEDIFGTLSKGGTYHIVDKASLFDLEQLRQYIEKEGVSILNSVPNLLFELLGGQPRLKSLDCIISGGDKLSNWVKEELLAIGYHLYNNYGPTEITVDALAGPMQDGPVTIGKPIANTKIYILNEEHQLQGLGMPGKLFVAGAGVARGYLHRPSLTAEKFIINPFTAGERMYDTGDWAYWQPNGEVVFVGRKDEQVKVRGHRIELTEVEATIQAYARGISEVVVTVVDQMGEQALVAYLLANRNLDKGALRQYLKEQLPDYMVPNYFVALQELPLMNNGKIDFAALPPVSEADLLRPEFLAPRDEIETDLVNIWMDVLGLEKVGVRDNFFELGGNSMKVMKMIYQIKRGFELDLKPRIVFENPTIEGMAGPVKFAVEQLKLASDKNELIELEL